MNRRGFLGSVLAAFAAPAFVKAEILMPVKPAIWTPPQKLILDESGASVLTIFNAAGLVLATVQMHGDDLADLSKKTLAMQGDSIVSTTGMATSFELSRGGKWMVKGGVGTDLILNNTNLVTGQDLHTQFNLSMFKNL